MEKNKDQQKKQFNFLKKKTPITSAANSGADVFRVMDVSRHKSVNIVKTYVRRAKQFDDHAGQSFM